MVRQQSENPIVARVRRGDEHFRDLDTEVKEFLQANPYEISHEFDPDDHKALPPPINKKGAHLYRVNIRHPIPDRVPILAGDILKDYRSSLDYLAWQLAESHHKPPPPMTAFPIFADKKRYRRDRLRYLGGIDPALHPEFDAVQPFASGEAPLQHPLWLLHRLANDDKHKAPHIVGSIPTEVAAPMFGDGCGISSTIGPFEDGDVIAAFGSVHGQIDPPPPMQATFTLAFDPNSAAAGQPLWDLLSRIRAKVIEVLGSLGEHLGDV